MQIFGQIAAGNWKKTDYIYHLSSHEQQVLTALGTPVSALNTTITAWWLGIPWFCGKYVTNFVDRMLSGLL